MKVRHRMGDSPGRYIGHGVSTRPNDVVNVDEETAEYLVQEAGYFEYVEEPSETCDAVKSDGEVCGRELPCRFHSDTED